MDAPFPPGMVEEVERFLEGDRSQPGLDLYEEVFLTHDMFPLQRKGELSQMMRAARSVKPKTVMEIGSDKGGGLYHWCRCLPTVTRVIACEIRGTPFAESFERAFPHIEFLWLSASSHHHPTVSATRTWLEGTQIDCLFIDGDKLEFVRDFDAWLPLMNPRGVVFMHDVTDREPKRAFEEVKARGHETELIVDRSDAEWAVERQKEDIPCGSAHEGWLRHWQGRSCGVGVIRLGNKA